MRVFQLHLLQLVEYGLVHWQTLADEPEDARVADVGKQGHRVDLPGVVALLDSFEK